VYNYDISTSPILDNGKIMRRKMIRAVVKFLFWLFSRVEVIGYENFPSSGSCIVAANHMSRIDPPLLFAICTREDMTALATDKYKRYPFIRWLLDGAGAIWINRESADVKALRAACEFLQNGGMLGIAPEGTRSRNGQLQPAKTGAAYLADKSGAPILPVAISGSEKVWWELAHLRRPRLCVQAGALFTLPPLDRRDREGWLQRSTDEIMCRIAAMLPAQYWGAYANHLRLIELVSQPEEPVAMPTV
jgi:1-acyl-sn-glycerol-3-phosphate acyltransferase